MLLHDLKEFDNNLGARSDEDLTLASPLGVVDGLQRIVENACSNHSVWRGRFSDGNAE